MLKTLVHLDARIRLGIGFIFAAAAWFALQQRALASTAIISAWDAFAFVTLALEWLSISRTPQKQIRRIAQAQDPSRFFVFIFVVVAACAALFAVAFLLRVHKDAAQTHLTLHVLLSLATIGLSWLLVHTAFAFHYAHIFYGDNDEPAQDRHAGGLDFPGKHPPDYFDFAYYSFVIGMTFQVSDVQITSQRLRRLGLIHGVLSFAFNTVILAMFINTVTSLV